MINSEDFLCIGYSGPTVRFDSIVAPKESNLRTVYNDIPELTASIEEQGLLEPLVLKPIVNSRNEAGFFIGDKYIVISGFRRYYAIKGSKYTKEYTKVPAILKVFETEGLEKLAQLAENTGKETLKNYDIAVALTKFENQYKLRRDEIVKRSGLSSAKVSQLICCLKPVSEGGLSPEIISVWQAAPNRDKEIPLYKLNSWRGKPEEIQSKLLKNFVDGLNEENPDLSDESDDRGPKLINKPPGKRKVKGWIKEIDKRLRKDKNSRELQAIKKALRYSIGEVKEPL